MTRVRNHDVADEIERIMAAAHRVMDTRGYPPAPLVLAQVVGLWGSCDACGVFLEPSDEWPLCASCMDGDMT